MRRLIGSIALAGALVFALVAGASAHGINPHRLSHAGWSCFNVEGLGVHCVPPGTDATTARITLLVFDTSDPGDEDAPLAGTELLLRADLYRGQPCSADDGGPYHGLDLDMNGSTDYFACHHYQTSP